MSVEVKVPEMGESIIEATISNWIKGEGDQVSAGEAVVELETDKVNLEVSAPGAGIIERIHRQVGDTVVVGEVIASIALSGAPAAEEQVQAEVVEEAAPEPAEPEKKNGASAVKATPLGRTNCTGTLGRSLAGQTNRQWWAHHQGGCTGISWRNTCCCTGSPCTGTSRDTKTCRDENRTSRGA
jgi:2-oxoglutarate dehydrogenase E2 component (dihydrolipoamide succinyltransferase)